MDLHRLEVFCKVIDHKSFTKAAEASLLTQPTVSEHIRSLETTLGTPLVDRLGREILPTQAGKILYRYARRLLKLRQEAVEAIARHTGNLRGHLWVGASTIPGTYILPGLIGAFKQRYPEIQITLRIANSRKVAEEVLHGEADFGVVGARWNEPGLLWQEVFADELTLAVCSTHPWAERGEIDLAELATEPLICRERESGTQKVMTETLARHGLDLGKLRVIAEMGSTEAVRQSVKARIGVAILSRRAILDDVACDALREVAIKGVRFPRSFYLVRRKKRHLPPMCSLFLDSLTAASRQAENPPPQEPSPP